MLHERDPGDLSLEPADSAPADPLALSHLNRAEISPVPSVVKPTFQNHASLTPVISDPRALAGLLDRILEVRGLTINEQARRMGLARQTLSQYMTGRRGSEVGLRFFLKFCEAADVKVSVDLRSKNG